ncbi:hypothetical protein GCM10028832_03900 [Streptomyces sparsus]
MTAGAAAMVSWKGVRTAASAERTSAVSVDTGAVDSRIRGCPAVKARLWPRSPSSRTTGALAVVESRSKGQ